MVLKIIMGYVLIDTVLLPNFFNGDYFCVDLTWNDPYLNSYTIIIKNTSSHKIINPHCVGEWLLWCCVH